MKKILIIEDDVLISEMYAAKFKEAGFEVKLANDGEEGVNCLSDFAPDLVLADVVLPKSDGFEVLKKVRGESKSGKNIRFVFLSNAGEKDDVEKGKKLGADDYIIKAHFTPTQVVEKVKKDYGL